MASSSSRSSILQGLFEAAGDDDDGVLVSVCDALLEMGKRRAEDTVAAAMEFVDNNRKVGFATVMGVAAELTALFWWSGHGLLGGVV